MLFIMSCAYHVILSVGGSLGRAPESENTLVGIKHMTKRSQIEILHFIQDDMGV